MGLGAGGTTPIQMAAAYAVFANGGYRIAPYLIARITDSRGNVLSQAKPEVVGENAERAIDPRNAFIMTTLLRDVIAYGTATRAQELKRKDLAGKTGTTNEYVDAWFCGFNLSQVGIAWIGFDQPKSLGGHETGASVSAPVFRDFMAAALKDKPAIPFRIPPGIRLVRVNPVTGLLAQSGDKNVIYEAFKPGTEPTTSEAPAAPARSSSRRVTELMAENVHRANHLMRQFPETDTGHHFGHSRPTAPKL